MNLEANEQKQANNQLYSKSVKEEEYKNINRVELNLIIGPMFAGKTTYLINKVNELIQNGISEQNIILVNHSSDSRYDTGKIFSHNGLYVSSFSMEYLNQLNITPSTLYNLSTQTTSFNNPILNPISNPISNTKYLFIDEGQFFTDCYEYILKIMRKFSQENQSLIIYIFGLDGDFKQKPFNNGSCLLELIPFCNSITKLQAKCYKCNLPAPFSKRLIDSDEQILVGGSNLYQPSCFQHL